MFRRIILTILLSIPSYLLAQTYTRQIKLTGNDQVYNDTIQVVIGAEFVRIGSDCYQIEKKKNKTYYLSEGNRLRVASNGLFIKLYKTNYYYDRPISNRANKTSSKRTKTVTGAK